MRPIVNNGWTPQIGLAVRSVPKSPEGGAVLVDWCVEEEWTLERASVLVFATDATLNSGLQVSNQLTSEGWQAQQASSRRGNGSAD